MFIILAACDEKSGLSKDGVIPWKNKQHDDIFKSMIAGHIVIMGRKTFSTLKHPLDSSINIVLSRTPFTADNVIVETDFVSCVRRCLRESFTKKLYVMGGAEIYKLFLDYGLVNELYITHISGEYKCDVKMPNFRQMPLTKTHHIIKGAIITHYIAENVYESRFLQLGKEILDAKSERLDRTKTGTLSLFGKHLEFDLSREVFPLLTSRKMFFRGIFEELMFYLRGQTDNSILVSKGINVWTPNTTREFLDGRGLKHLPVGDMGPSYGFLFRHFGAKYVNCQTDYAGQGVDQLANVIHKIKTNPTNRRIIITLWDPTNEDLCPLPPCLYNYQFYVDNGYLSCMMTQRSSDYAVAGGWNVATGALLTILLAKVCDLSPDKLIWNIGDVHVYKNLVDQFKEQLERHPNFFPRLYLEKKENITDYEFKDLELLGYEPFPPIQFQLSV
jgi:thymidylate synthase